MDHNKSTESDWIEALKWKNRWGKLRRKNNIKSGHFTKNFIILLVGITCKSITDLHQRDRNQENVKYTGQLQQDGDM